MYTQKIQIKNHYGVLWPKILIMANILFYNIVICVILNQLGLTYGSVILSKIHIHFRVKRF